MRGYVVLVVTALGFGSFGLLASSLVKRTQAATAISVFGVLFVSIGSIFLLIFWQAMASSRQRSRHGPIKGSPPPIIAYLNPFLAQVDVLCGTESSFGGWCSIESSLLGNTNAGIIQPVVEPAADEGRPGHPAGARRGRLRSGRRRGQRRSGRGRPSPDDADALKRKLAAVGNDQVAGAVNGGFVGPADVVPFGVARDAFWPKSVATWLVLSVVFLVVAVQFVSPTRRWHLRRRRAVAARAS